MAERESIMRKMNGFGMMAKRGTAAAMAAAMALTMAGCGRLECGRDDSSG